MNIILGTAKGYSTNLNSLILSLTSTSLRSADLRRLHGQPGLPPRGPRAEGRPPGREGQQHTPRRTVERQGLRLRARQAALL